MTAVAGRIPGNLDWIEAVEKAIRGGQEVGQVGTAVEGYEQGSRNGHYNRSSGSIVKNHARIYNNDKDLYLVIPETINRMVIDHTRCLHMCVHDSRSHELEAALDQILADRIGQRRFGRNLLE